MSARYIVVSGGVISGIGKGVSAASLGLLLRLRGHTVQMVKFDPYLNGSASLLSPTQHGEVYLCDDGSETDLDLGWYERITGIEVSSRNICTHGRINAEIGQDEAAGKYLGKTVQMVPHVTDKVIGKLIDLGADTDVVIVEIGGTVGDVESWVFFEAVAQLRRRLGESNVLLIHVAPVLWVGTIQEHKTKPLQNSIRDLQRQGLHPDILLCRDLGHTIPTKMLDKVAEMSGVPREAVFDAPDTPTIYSIALEFYDRHIDDLIADRFHLRRNGVRIHRWRELAQALVSPTLPTVTVGVVGKYMSCQDAYLSLKEAIHHAAVANECRAEIRWIEAEAVEKVDGLLAGLDAVIVPGGFDSRGVEGKVRAINHCRTKGVPFLGICLGLQCAVIEFARNVCGIADATSQEFGKGTHVVHEVPMDRPGGRMAGTLRLGSQDCVLVKGSAAHEAYKKRNVSERHRHRYEVNREHVPALSEAGLVVSGTNPVTDLVEVMELDRRHKHPFFVGCQGHPEFKSRLGSPNPLFEGLLRAAAKALKVGEDDKHAEDLRA